MCLLQQGPGPAGKNEEKAQVLTEKIEDLVVQVSNNLSRPCATCLRLVVGVIHHNMMFWPFPQIEELGSEGRVEEAQGMMKLVEQLKEERELLSSTPSVSKLTRADQPEDATLKLCTLSFERRNHN